MMLENHAALHAGRSHHNVHNNARQVSWCPSGMDNTHRETPLGSAVYQVSVVLEELVSRFVLLMLMKTRLLMHCLSLKNRLMNRLSIMYFQCRYHRLNHQHCSQLFRHRHELAVVIKLTRSGSNLSGLMYSHSKHPPQNRLTARLEALCRR